MPAWRLLAKPKPEPLMTYSKFSPILFHIYCQENVFWNVVHMLAILSVLQCVNTLRPRQNGHRFPDDFFKGIFINENVWVSIKISLKFVLEGSISNIPALVQIMALRRPGDKPLSEPMVVNLLTHKCVTRPQCVNAVVPQMEGDKLACTLSRPICNLHKTDEPTAQNLLWLAVWHNS